MEGSTAENHGLTEVGDDDSECRICRGGVDVGPLVSVSCHLAYIATACSHFDCKVVADAAEVTLLNYCINGSALGNVGTLATTDMSAANFFSATAVADCTWAFTNPCTTGDFGGFVLELNAGGSYTQNWPASVDWPGGTAPTLSTGKDLLVFVTRDAGTTYHGMRASEDSQ